MSKVRAFAFLCPECQHAFRRPSNKQLLGSTSCPNCHERFKRYENRLTGADVEKLIRRPNGPLRIDHTGIDAIRGEQIPASGSEALFKQRCAALGWKPHRPSWPDFLVERNGEMICVEVKSRSDDVSQTQRATFILLEAMGIPVYIWRNSKSERHRLKRFQPLRLVTRPAAGKLSTPADVGRTALPGGD